jgi:hypothetical protein
MGSLAVLAAVQLLAFGEGGVRVGDATIVSTPVDAAAYDPALDLVWWVGGGKLEVSDLRAPASKPVVIARGMPEGAFAIAGASSAQYAVDDATAPYPVLRIAGGKGTIAAAGPSTAGASEVKAAKKAIKKVKIVGAAWLKALAARAVHAVDATAESSLPSLTLGDGLAACDDDPTRCGSARALAGTRYELVVVADECSDGCVDRCVLYDPVRQLFASPTQTSAAWGAPMLTPDTCSGYAVEPGGARYAIGTELCTLGDTITCVLDAAWIKVAWVVG